MTLLQNCIVKFLLWFACGEVSGAIAQVSTIKLHSFMASNRTNRILLLKSKMVRGAADIKVREKSITVVRNLTV